MKVIGVVGGIASGKSFVTEQLKSFGAAVLDADQIGHEVLMDEAVKTAVRQHWGPTVFDTAGQIERGKLAARVFDPQRPEELKQLEMITHPRIAERLRARIAEFSAAGDIPFLVLDAPVMVKAGWHVFCDLILFVDVPLATRRQRAALRGWTTQMFDNREAMQAPLDEKRRISTHVIHNNGTRQATKQQLVEFWDRMTSSARSSNSN